MVVRFRSATGDAAIPRVAIAVLGEDGRVALQRCVLCIAGGSASHISSDNEVAHCLRGPTHGDVRQYFVEELEFRASALIRDNTAILP